MKVKTKDKIAYLVKNAGVSAKELKEFSKKDPKQFDKMFEKVKNSSTVKMTNSGPIAISNLQPYIGVDFSQYSFKEKLDHEAFIRKTSSKLLEYIEEFNLVGACASIPYFYKIFLQDNGVPVDVEYGVFELNNGFSVHSWNRYDGKLIDITAYLQKYEISGDAVVLDEVIKKGQDSIVYHRADQLPANYLNMIEQMAIREMELKDLHVNDGELAHCKEMLDIDSYLCRALRKNYNSYDVLTNEYLCDFVEQYEHFLKNFAEKYKSE